MTAFQFWTGVIHDLIGPVWSMSCLTGFVMVVMAVFTDNSSLFMLGLPLLLSGGMLGIVNRVVLWPLAFPRS